MSVFQKPLSRRHVVGAGVAATGAILLPSMGRADPTMDRLMSTGTVIVGIANEKP